MDKDAANRRDEFLKEFQSFMLMIKNINLILKLFAQGQGVWQDYCLDNGIIEDGYDVVVDIGYRTNDAIVFKKWKNK